MIKALNKKFKLPENLNFLSSKWSIVALGTLAAMAVFGFTVGCLAGILIAVSAHFFMDDPSLMEGIRYTVRGSEVLEISVIGKLTASSVASFRKEVLKHGDHNMKGLILLINTEDMPLLTKHGAYAILRTIFDWKKTGRHAYIYVSNTDFLKPLTQVNANITENHSIFIRPDSAHPMKYLLQHVQPNANQQSVSVIADKAEKKNQSLAARLRTTPLLGSLEEDIIDSLVEKSGGICKVGKGKVLSEPSKPLEQHLIIVSGKIDMERIWTLGGENKTYKAALTVADDMPEVIMATFGGLRITTVTNLEYILLDATELDKHLGWSNLREEVGNTKKGEVKLMLARNLSNFHNLPEEMMLDEPTELIHEIVGKMEILDLSRGEVVIKEGDVGDSYYLIQYGQADVIRNNKDTGQPEILTQIGEGKGFGEEALLKDSVRNATIRMISAGRLWKLNRADFEVLIEPLLMKEMSAKHALANIQYGNYQLIDCREQDEYQVNRIPGASLLPLTTLRENIHILDPDIKYLVYCDNGKRSRAAAYLLQEHNFNATSVQGGLNKWPYDIDKQAL